MMKDIMQVPLSEAWEVAEELYQNIIPGKVDLSKHKKVFMSEKADLIEKFPPDGRVAVTLPYESFPDISNGDLACAVLIRRLRLDNKCSEAIGYTPPSELLENAHNVLIGAPSKMQKSLKELLCDDVRKSFGRDAECNVDSWLTRDGNEEIAPRSGKFYISINPLDVLLSATNPNGKWRSCHNIINGEKKTGALYWACEKTSFVMFATGKEGLMLGAVAPNKTWRQLGHASVKDRWMVPMRHYPGILELRRTMVMHSMAMELFFGAYLGKKHSGNVSFITNQSAVYVDTPYVSVAYADNNQEIIIDGASVPVQCIRCGESDSKNYFPPRYICKKCESSITCSRCRRPGAQAKLTNGRMVCGNCIARGFVSSCSKCSGLILAAAAIKVFDKNSSQKTYCTRCFVKSKIKVAKCKRCNKVTNKNSVVQFQGLPYCYECYGARRMCCMCKEEDVTFVSLPPAMRALGYVFACHRCLESRFGTCAWCCALFKHSDLRTMMALCDGGRKLSYKLCSVCRRDLGGDLSGNSMLECSSIVAERAGLDLSTRHPGENAIWDEDFFDEDR